MSELRSSHEPVSRYETRCSIRSVNYISPKIKIIETQLIFILLPTNALLRQNLHHTEKMSDVGD
jgi:hypothetical protein